MEKDFKLEVRRQLFHLFALFSWLIPIALLPRSFTLALMFVVLLVNLALMFKVGESAFGMLYRLVYFFEREENLQKPAVQAFWANLGISLSFLLFDRCVMPSVVVLAVGDAFSTLVGVKHGRRKLLGRSLEGSLAFFLSSLLVLLFPYGFLKAFLFSFVGALTELLSRKVDDNLSIPLAVSLSCYLFKLF